MVALSTLRNFPHGSDPMRFLFFRASRKVEVLIFLSRFFRRLYFQLLTFNFQLSDSRGSSLFHKFPQFFRIPRLPQTLSLSQLEPHCVNPATSIRITNKLSLTSVYYRGTIPFELDAPIRPSPAPPHLCGRTLPRFGRRVEIPPPPAP